VRDRGLTPKESIARYRASCPAGRPDPQLSRGSPGAELLATRDARAYAEWLCRAPLLRASDDRYEPSGDGGELRGLVLRGGSGSQRLPDDNPWGLPPTIDLEPAVHHLWTSAAEALPDFIGRLAQRTFAIAIVRHDGRDHVVYLTAAWVSRDVPDVAAASIEELMDARELTVGDIWGSTPLPLTDDDTIAVLDGPMPPTLRTVAAVHGRLTFLEEERYIDLEDIEAYGEAIGQDVEGSYAMFAGMHDAWFVLDLGWIRDGLGDPTVLQHDPNDGLILGSRQRLRPFLAGHLTDMLDAAS
jgi:hypothetical protein